MKHFLVTVLMSVLMCFVAYGQAQNEKSKGVSKPEQQVMALNRAWADAIFLQFVAIVFFTESLVILLFRSRLEAFSAQRKTR